MAVATRAHVEQWPNRHVPVHKFRSHLVSKWSPPTQTDRFINYLTQIGRALDSERGRLVGCYGSHHSRFARDCSRPQDVNVEAGSFGGLPNLIKPPNAVAHTRTMSCICRVASTLLVRAYSILIIPYQYHISELRIRVESHQFSFHFKLLWSNVCPPHIPRIS